MAHLVGGVCRLRHTGPVRRGLDPGVGVLEPGTKSQEHRTGGLSLADTAGHGRVILAGGQAVVESLAGHHEIVQRSMMCGLLSWP